MSIKIHRIFLLVILSVVVLSCAPAATLTPAPAPTATPFMLSEVETSTPAPVPTQTPSAEQVAVGSDVATVSPSVAGYMKTVNDGVGYELKPTMVDGQFSGFIHINDAKGDELPWTLIGSDGTVTISDGVGTSWESDVSGLKILTPDANKPGEQVIFFTDTKGQIVKFDGAKWVASSADEMQKIATGIGNGEQSGGEQISEVAYGDRYVLKGDTMVYRGADGKDMATPITVSGDTAKFTVGGQEVVRPAKDVGYFELAGRDDLLVVRNDQGQVEYFYSDVTHEMMTPLSIQRNYENINGYTPITIDDVTSGRVRDSELLSGDVTFPPEAKNLGINVIYVDGLKANEAYFKVPDVNNPNTWPMKPGGYYLIKDSQGKESYFSAVHVLNVDGSQSIVMGEYPIRNAGNDAGWLRNVSGWEKSTYASDEKTLVITFITEFVENWDKWATSQSADLIVNMNSDSQKKAAAAWVATGVVPDYMELSLQMLRGKRYDSAKPGMMP